LPVATDECSLSIQGLLDVSCRARLWLVVCWVLIGCLDVYGPDLLLIRCRRLVPAVRVGLALVELQIGQVIIWREFVLIAGFRILLLLLAIFVAWLGLPGIGLVLLAAQLSQLLRQVLLRLPIAQILVHWIWCVEVRDWGSLLVDGLSVVLVHLVVFLFEVLLVVAVQMMVFSWWRFLPVRPHSTR